LFFSFILYQQSSLPLSLLLAIEGKDHPLYWNFPTFFLFFAALWRRGYFTGQWDKNRIKYVIVGNGLSLFLLLRM
jgi:hypothetical protein